VPNQGSGEIGTLPDAIDPSETPLVIPFLNREILAARILSINERDGTAGQFPPSGQVRLSLFDQAFVVAVVGWHSERLVQ
jgi:hypothetical protein